MMASEMREELPRDQLIHELTQGLSEFEITVAYRTTLEQVRKRLWDEFAGDFSCLDDYAEGFFGYVWVVDRVVPLSQVAAWIEDGESWCVVNQCCGPDEHSLRSAYERWRGSDGRFGGWLP